MGRRRSLGIAPSKIKRATGIYNMKRAHLKSTTNRGNRSLSGGNLIGILGSLIQLTFWIVIILFLMFAC